MKIFKDSEGREWSIEINLDARNQVKAATDVDFLDVECISQLADLATLGSVLYALCQEQIEKRGLTDRQFARSLKGDAFDGARAALESELCDFFPSGKRQVLIKALAKVQASDRMALAAAHEMLDSGAIESAVQERLSGLSGSLPGSSASIPGD